MSRLIGFHKDIDSVDYHRIDAASSHRLGLLRKSPAHLKWELSNPTPPTDAMRFGEAVHMLILEPHKFHTRFIKGILADGRTKEGKQKKEDFQKLAGDRHVFSPETFNDIQNIAIACKDHSLASALIALATDTELSGFFEDPTTGIYCKMRIDAYCEHQETIFDIKTTLDASPTEFEKSIFNFGYHRQAAFYLDGANLLGKKAQHFAIIAVEKNPPYGISVFRLKNESIELGRKENQGLMKLYAQCLKENKWPGYPDQFVDVGLPVWAQKQIERSLNGQ